jgi:hypothetical protein
MAGSLPVRLLVDAYHSSLPRREAIILQRPKAKSVSAQYHRVRQESAVQCDDNAVDQPALCASAQPQSPGEKPINLPSCLAPSIRRS